MGEILLIDKPKGISSFDAIRELRKKLNTRKIGHAGTLDPLASGLLIIGVGAGTKKLTEYIKLPKTYEVEILLGQSRTTGDMEGEIIADTGVADPDQITEDSVATVLDEMVNEEVLELPVPAYSAIKQWGEPLYKKARRGETFEPPVKPMEITGANLLDISYEKPYVVTRLRLDVGSGAYVRSIVEEIGRQLGYPAVVRELRRTRIGEYSIDDARTLEEIETTTT